MSLIEKWYTKGFDYIEPQIVIANITPRCNLKCSHCYWSHNIKESSIDDWSKSVKEIKKLNCYVVYAGRILSQNGAKFVNLFHKETSQKLGIIDNGWTILNHPDILPLFDQISISIDGQKKDHDRLRNKNGAWDYSMKTLRKLKSKDYDPVVSSVITPFNLKNWYIFEEILEMEDIPMSSTFVWDLPQTKKRGLINWDKKSLNQAWEILLSGTPKLVNLYSLTQIELLSSHLKKLNWENEEGSLKAKIGDVVIRYRPSSVISVSEIDLYWDGILYTSIATGDKIPLHKVDLNFFKEVNRMRSRELRIWRNIL